MIFPASLSSIFALRPRHLQLLAFPSKNHDPTSQEEGNQPKTGPPPGIISEDEKFSTFVARHLYFEQCAAHQVIAG